MLLMKLGTDFSERVADTRITIKPFFYWFETAHWFLEIWILEFVSTHSIQNFVTIFNLLLREVAKTGHCGYVLSIFFRLRAFCDFFEHLFELFVCFERGLEPRKILYVFAAEYIWCVELRVRHALRKLFISVRLALDHWQNCFGKISVMVVVSVLFFLDHIKLRRVLCFDWHFLWGRVAAN